MKHWKLLVGVALIASCGQLGLQTNKSSKLDSLAADKGAMITDEDIAQLSRTKHQELHYLGLMAYQDLHDFDQSLAHNWHGIMKSGPYSKLLAARVQIETLAEELHVVQQELLARAEDDKLEVSDRINALRSLGQTLPTIEQTRGAWAHTLWRQHRRHKILARHLLMAQGRTSEVALQQAMEKVYDEVKARYGLFDESDVQTPGWKETIAKEFSRLKLTPAMERMTKSVEHAAHELRFEFQKLEKSSKAFDENNSIRPSTTSAGHITGDEFPAKVWSLTFNDGPIPGHTNKLVDTLSEQQFSGTFFQLTQLAEQYPRTAKYVRLSGMEFASLGNNLQDLGKASAEERDLQIRQASGDLVKLHASSAIQFFRLPYGSGASIREVRARIANEQLVHASWNVDALDWLAQPSQDIAARVIKQMSKTSQESGIVLFHETLDQTVPAVQQVTQYMKLKGHRSCALNEIVSQINRKASVCPNKLSISSN